jgi:hypothetical protein
MSMRKFTLCLATSQILFATLSMMSPTSMPQAQQSLTQNTQSDSDDDNSEHHQCMSQTALRRFVSAKGYSDLTFQSRRDELSRVEGVKDGSLYLIVVNTCAQRIVSHNKIGAV